MQNLNNKNVLVMGLGRFGGGVGVTQFLSQQGANVTVTDLLKKEELTESLQKLSDLNINYRLGQHHLHDFTNTDLLVVNPAVNPQQNQFIQAATKANVPLTSEIQLLLERVNPNQVIGITGTAGKSTTTALLGHILKQTLTQNQVHVGGNIGGSLLTKLQNIKPNDILVIELSSFMLEQLHNWSPHIAIVTNISDNHLDRHHTMQAYANAKLQLLRNQNNNDHAILGPSVHHWTKHTQASTTLCTPENAAALTGDWQIPGTHNRMNALMAIQAAKAVGINETTAINAGQTFPGLAHRLELVTKHHGIRFYNDSKSTTPASAKLAIDAFPTHTVHIILGGYDKQANLNELATYAAEQCVALYTIGQTGNAIATAAQSQGHTNIHQCDELHTAMKTIIKNAKSNQTVVLSPGCASWDQFTNYEERGQLFSKLARQEKP